LPQLKEPCQEATPKLKSHTRTAKAKILVVDDEPAVASVITECLETAGFEPEMTTDSVAALGRISAVVYDLIVSDIAMPGLTAGEPDASFADDLELVSAFDQPPRHPWGS